MSAVSLKDALSALGHLAHLKAGEVLFSTGEPCQNVFLIIQGKVRCDAEPSLDVWHKPVSLNVRGCITGLELK